MGPPALAGTSENNQASESAEITESEDGVNYFFFFLVWATIKITIIFLGFF